MKNVIAGNPAYCDGVMRKHANAVQVWSVSGFSLVLGRAYHGPALFSPWNVANFN